MIDIYTLLVFTFMAYAFGWVDGMHHAFKPPRVVGRRPFVNKSHRHSRNGIVRTMPIRFDDNL
jgi:hypothetical protein